MTRKTAEIPGVGAVPLAETQVDGPRVEFMLPVEGGLRLAAEHGGGLLSGLLWQGGSPAPGPTSARSGWDFD